MNRKMDVLYYSATGNTKLVVDRIVKVLSNNQIELSIKSLVKPYEHKRGRELLLSFPVNSQAVSPFVFKAIKSLPQGNGENVYVLITMNESANILNILRKLLEKKGYKTVGCKEISMPNNLFVGEDKTIERLSNGLEQAELFAEEIVSNKTLWIETKKGSAFVSFLSRNTNLPWVTMRLFNKLVVNTEKCTKCGKCVIECPVQNIEMIDFPKHLNNCQFCMRCGSMCPNSAIMIKNKPKYQIRKTNQKNQDIL